MPKIIVMADDGIAFDGKLAESAPMGGAEAAFVGLAEALAQRGHTVTVYNNCSDRLDHKLVAWRPLAGGTPESADLYIANRGDKLLRRVPASRRVVFWIHNPASYLLKWRYLSRLAWRRPDIVFSGPSHASTYPRWAPSGGRVIIPYGIAEIFRTASPAVEPLPCDAIMVDRSCAVIGDGDAMAAPCQRLGEPDEGRLGAAHRGCFRKLAVEGDAVIGHDDVGHRQAGYGPRWAPSIIRAPPRSRRPLADGQACAQEGASEWRRE